MSAERQHMLQHWHVSLASLQSMTKVSRFVMVSKTRNMEEEESGSLQKGDVVVVVMS
jgi:hypothetical protein